MAVQSPNQYISGPSMWADVPDVPGQLLQGYQQLLQQQATPDEEELRKALALREQYMQERGNAAPTYMPSDATMAYGQGSLASVPHTAGYAGPTRVSDLLFPQPVQLRTTAGNVPLPGAPGRKTGELTDLLAASKGASKEGQDALMRGLGMDIPDPRIEAARLRADALTQGRQDRDRAAFDRVDLSNWYSRKTGEPAGVDQIGNMDDLRKDYMRLNALQKKDAQVLPGLGTLIQSYKRLATEIPFPQDNMGDRTAWLGTVAQMKLNGDPRLTDLESINAQISQLATGLGGDKRISDKEMALLKGAVINSTDTAPGIARKMANLEEFYRTRTKASGLPWLQPKVTDSQASTGMVTMRAPDGSTRQVPQNQVDYYLKKGGTVVK